MKGGGGLGLVAGVEAESCNGQNVVGRALIQPCVCFQTKSGELDICSRNGYDQGLAYVSLVH